MTCVFLSIFFFFYELNNTFLWHLTLSSDDDSDRSKTFDYWNGKNFHLANDFEKLVLLLSFIIQHKICFTDVKVNYYFNNSQVIQNSYCHFPQSIIQTIVKLFPGGSDGKASVYNVGDLGSIPGSGRSPGEGNGHPLQYYCLENPMDRGAWWATVHGVAKSRTRLSNFTHSLVWS